MKLDIEKKKKKSKKTRVDLFVRRRLYGPADQLDAVVDVVGDEEGAAGAGVGVVDAVRVEHQAGRARQVRAQQAARPPRRAACRPNHTSSRMLSTRQAPSSEPRVSRVFPHFHIFFDSILKRNAFPGHAASFERLHTIGQVQSSPQPSVVWLFREVYSHTDANTPSKTAKARTGKRK